MTARDPVLEAAAVFSRGGAALALAAGVLAVAGPWLPAGTAVRAELAAAAALLVYAAGRAMALPGRIACTALSGAVCASSLLWGVFGQRPAGVVRSDQLISWFLPFVCGGLVILASRLWTGRFRPEVAALAVTVAGGLAWYAHCPWRLVLVFWCGVMASFVLVGVAAGLEEAWLSGASWREAVGPLGGHLGVAAAIVFLGFASAGPAGAVWLKAGGWLVRRLALMVALVGLPMSLGSSRSMGHFAALGPVTGAVAWFLYGGDKLTAFVVALYAVCGWALGCFWRQARGRFDRVSLSRWAVASAMVPVLLVGWRNPMALLAPWGLPFQAAPLAIANGGILADGLGLLKDLPMPPGLLEGSAGMKSVPILGGSGQIDLNSAFTELGFPPPEGKGDQGGGDDSKDKAREGESHVLFEVRGKDIGCGYFRLGGLERYLGNGWSRAPDVPPGPNWPARMSHEVAYTVKFGNAASSGDIPALWHPVQVSEGRVTSRGEAVVPAGSPAKTGSEFEVVSEIPDLRGLVPLMRAAGTSYPAAVKRECLAVPPSVPQRVRDLGAQVVERCSTPYDKAAAIERFLRTRYTYSYDGPEPPPGRDFVDFFLFGYQKGVCNHFATAMAIMCRCVGVPARVGVGGVPAGRIAADTYIVTKDSMHMWAEVYFPGIGWIPFDATGYAASGDSAGLVAALPLERHEGGPEKLPPRPQADTPGTRGPEGSKGNGQELVAAERGSGGEPYNPYEGLPGRIPTSEPFGATGTLEKPASTGTEGAKPRDWREDAAQGSAGSSRSKEADNGAARESETRGGAPPGGGPQGQENAGTAASGVAPGTAPNTPPNAPWKVAAVVAVAAGLLGGAGWLVTRNLKVFRQVGLWWWLRRRLTRQPVGPAEMFVDLYRGLLSDLKRCGLQRKPGETVLETASRLSAATGEVKFMQAAWIMSSVRYGGAAPDEADLDLVCVLRRQVRSRGKKPWRPVPVR